MQKGKTAAARKGTSVLDMLAHGKVADHPVAAAAMASHALAPATAAQHERRPQGLSQTDTETGLHPKQLFAGQTESEVSSKGPDGATADGRELSGSPASGCGGCREVEAPQWLRPGSDFQRWALDPNTSSADADRDPNSDPKPRGHASGRQVGALQPALDDVIDLLSPPSTQEGGDSETSAGGEQSNVIDSRDTSDAPLTPPETDARPGKVPASAQMRHPSVRGLAGATGALKGAAALVNDPVGSSKRLDDSSRAVVRRTDSQAGISVLKHGGSDLARTAKSGSVSVKLPGTPRYQNNISPASDIMVVLTPSTGPSSEKGAGSACRGSAQTSRNKRLTPIGTASDFIDLTQSGDS